MWPYTNGVTGGELLHYRVALRTLRTFTTLRSRLRPNRILRARIPSVRFDPLKQQAELGQGAHAHLFQDLATMNLHRHLTDTEPGCNLFIA